MENKDSFDQMLAAVRRFHEKHDFRNTGGEDLKYRIALMCEELGEISAAVTKGKGIEQLAEECGDLLILLIGMQVAAGFDLNEAFWKKLERVSEREARLIDGTVRVSEFDSAS